MAQPLVLAQTASKDLDEGADGAGSMGGDGGHEGGHIGEQAHGRGHMGGGGGAPARTSRAGASDASICVYVSQCVCDASLFV